MPHIFTQLQLRRFSFYCWKKFVNMNYANVEKIVKTSFTFEKLHAVTKHPLPAFDVMLIILIWYFMLIKYT